MQNTTKRPAPWLDHDLLDREGEEWRDIIGYDGVYQVSNLGRIKSLGRYSASGQRLKPRIRKPSIHSGAAVIALFSGNVAEHRMVSAVVATAFLIAPDDGEWCIHRNKIGLDNRVVNILVGTPKQSMAVAIAVGTFVNNEYSLANFRSRVAAEYWKHYGVFSNGILLAKICTACAVERPLSLYQFTAVDGVNSRICKICQSVRLGVKNPGSSLVAKEMRAAGLRRCNGCGETKQLEGFNRNASAPEGRKHRCAACEKRSRLQSSSAS